VTANGSQESDRLDVYEIALDPQFACDELVEQTLRRFAAEMRDNGVGIKNATYSLIVFCAASVATTICLVSDDDEERERSLEILAEAFVTRARRCISACPPTSRHAS
jgi:hypothetical protein